MHLESLRIQPVGVSADSEQAQLKFDQKNHLNFPLLSDPTHEVAERFGVWQEKSLYGKKSWGIVRSSFLIDPDGRIGGAWYKIKPEETVPKALEIATP